jgi:hypothetical protein
MNTEQIERIRRMEQVLDTSSEAVSSLAAALEQYQTILPSLQKLAEYYSSPLWMADFEADEAGMLPADLKRGVLSEDAVYDLLCSHSHLIKELKTIIEKNRR